MSKLSAFFTTLYITLIINESLSIITITHFVKKSIYLGLTEKLLSTVLTSESQLKALWWDRRSIFIFVIAVFKVIILESLLSVRKFT